MLFIMNPYAGMRKANRYLVDILSIFNRGGYEVTVHITSGRGDATAAASRKAKDMDIIVCCGGDGTFNETLSGVMQSGCDVPMGYIPAGSTNDFAASLGLSTNPSQAALDIVEGTPCRYDVGRFGNRYFCYVASFGAFTRVSYTTPQNVKNALGHTAYVLDSIQELSQIKKEHVRLELDGQVVEDDFIFGAISNSTSVGGILTLDPKKVDMRDGKFEILLVRAPMEFGEISECIRAVQRQEYNCSMVTFRSARKIQIYANEDMTWTLDGEREPGHEMVEAENLHHAVQIVRREDKNV